MALATRPTPVAGESLNRPDESKLSSVRFLLSPLVWLRQPALICDQRATGQWSDALMQQCILLLANRTTIKAFPQMGEGAERSEADEGECDA